MSFSQDEIRDFNSPIRSVHGKKNKKRNKISSPLDQSPVSNPNKKGDVFELFTIKTPTKEKLPSDSQDTSELSNDVFVKPKPVSISSPSKSETKSYRDKINERFKSVKEKAGKSTKKANVFKEATEKILLEKVKRESSAINAELELMRERLKLGRIPENRDLYEFFCTEKCTEEAEEENEENFKSTDDLTDDTPELEFILPTQCRTTLRNSEDALLFKPKAQPVDITDKIEEEEPRFLEEEGFYTPPDPKIPTQHLHILEQRLSHDTKKWFDCDGKLKILQNPYQRTSYRPHLKHIALNETATYIPARIEDQDCEEIVVVRENLLQLQIVSLKFSHHPLFSLEHVLGEKLKKLYHEHQECILKNDLTRLTRRLEGLRHVLKRWEETSSQSGDQSDREDTKIEAYKRDIKTLQEQAFEEGRKERERIKSILQTWKAIKKLRETNKHSNTSLKLIIRKENVDFEEEKENFEKTLDEVFEEYLEYNREKHKRRKQEVLKEDLVERFKESFRAPGEPILHFTLTNDNEITKDVENSKEITRRNVVSSTRIALKIVCNKMEVCKTKWVNLHDDFTCNFDETITIQLINIPKTITIEIIEQPKSLIKRTVGELNLKLPSRSVSENVKKTTNFEKNEIVHYKHEGVGSGVKLDPLLENLNLQLDNDQEIITSGSLTHSLSWDIPIRSKENNPEDVRKILGEIIDKNGAIDSEKLSQWMNRHKPDPQDPRNSILYEYNLDCGHDVVSATTKNYFRLNQNLEPWHFCDPKLLEDNLRFKILTLRNRNEPEFDRMVVPNRIKEIPLDILSDYKRRIASEREELIIEEDDDEDEIAAKRSRGRKYLKQIHIRVFQKCKNSQNNLTFEDVVDEKLLPQLEKLIKGLVASFIGWFMWRPLKPPLIQAKSETKLNDYDLQSQLRVFINVISGLNIPERLDKNEPVTPFVEVEYNGNKVRTATNKGPHPNWNEKLTLTLEPSHLDYLNPNSLNGTIILNIFDENDTNLMSFAGQKCQNWLGSVEVPLSAICFNGIQGMFKVKVPHLLLGYKSKNLEQNKGTINNTQTNLQTYLNLHLTMEPCVPKMNPTIEELPCSDLPYIQEHALKWNEDYNYSFPNRKFSVFAIDTNASTTCIVRYIKPLEPPQINVEGFDVTPEQCARFVSLIPFSDCNEFYKNIWLPTEKFLHFMIGSIIDHAIALTCYLLALKLEVWLLLGFGVPHGSTAYVLVKEYDNNQVPNHFLYDVVLGEKIELTDPFCPVHRIYCVVNEHNVWANIQRNNDVTITRFDLTRRNDWLPLFDNQIPAPTNSVHGKIIYLPRPSTDELEIIIDRKFRKRMSKLRPLNRTIWNHHISNVFKNVLSSFEKTEMYGKSNSEALDKMNDCIKTHKLRGHVFNSSFIDVSTMVKRVQAYGLHLEEDDSTQFASAVCLRAYPNQVLTVWVFLAAIKAKKK